MVFKILGDVNIKRKYPEAETALQRCFYEKVF